LSTKIYSVSMLSSSRSSGLYRSHPQLMHQISIRSSMKSLKKRSGMKLTGKVLWRNKSKS
jgi:hypothetical protein